jgi:hypothetical protein
MNNRPNYQGIAGMSGTIAVGGVLSIGHRREGGPGHPERRDRFFILTHNPTQKEFTRRQGGQYKALARDHHPAFRIFNADPKDGDGPKLPRNVIHGRLVFPTRDQNFRYFLRAKRLAEKTGPAPGGGILDDPGKGRPACYGDGRQASRFNGFEKDGTPIYLDVECPNQQCPFRQRPDPKCNPFSTLYFRPEWPEFASDLPQPLLKWSTWSEQNCQSALGMFELLADIATGAGLPTYSYLGLPFTMTLETRAIPEKQRRYPVVTFSLNDDVLAFLAFQQQQIQALGGQLPALPAAEGAPEVVDVEAAMLEGAPVPDLTVPAQTGLFDER